MTDINYSVSSIVAGLAAVVKTRQSSFTASSFQLECFNFTPSAQDADHVSVQVIR